MLAWTNVHRVRAIHARMFVLRRMLLPKYSPVARLSWLPAA
ncbi:hypothetical protein HMPREF9595_00336 [Cutibacterium acnes HL005PA2]|nr:hypothetical protein HMPREF9574_01711 [Cutibacterium acnes HL074PA1]EFT31965.1 hypothetical protein HMPREF9595_00336 [Cutibacterium acnes HL005PA2]